MAIELYIPVTHLGQEYHCKLADGFICLAITTSSCPLSLTHLLIRMVLNRTRAERAFWTPSTIQCGATVSHDSYIKCYVKIEIMDTMGTPLGGARNIQNLKSTHMDKDSIWTPIQVGPSSIPGGTKELRTLTIQCSSLAVPWATLESLSLHQKRTTTVAAWLETHTCLYTC